MKRNSIKRYPKNRPNVIDLFSGAGGLSLGFEQAGFNIALGVDRDGHHVAAHKRNFPQSNAICASVSDLSGDEILEAAGLSDGEIDVVIGGPPCQGFSHMGLRDETDARNTLVGEYARLVKELRPKAFLMENVPGMISGKMKHSLERILEDFESSGYRISRPVQILDASSFGVPQSRSRVFVLGIREDVSGEPITYPLTRCFGQPDRPTVSEAIEDLPTIEKYDQLFFTDTVEYDKKPKSEYAKVARGLLDDPSDLSIPRIWDPNVCTGCTRTKHTATTVDLYASTAPGSVAPGHKLPRLDPEGICPTLRAGSDSTRGSYTSPRPIHPDIPRCITTREAARLHGYPDWFRVDPVKWHGYKQIGNSVCPPIARALGRQILDALDVSWTTKKPIPLELNDDFELPENSPKQNKRIPHVKHYPPVIVALFDRAFDFENSTLRNSMFSFDDVLESVKETGVQLPWIRPDNFIQEIARSRNLDQIIAKPMKYGFSIAPLNNRQYIGEFVECGSENAIHRKDGIGIKANDFNRAREIEIDDYALNNISSEMLTFLNLAVVRKEVWSASVSKIRIAKTLPGMANGNGAVKLEVLRKGGKTSSPVAYVGKGGQVPPRSRIIKIAYEHQSDEVILIVRATAKHVLASRFIHCRDTPKQVKRIIFTNSAGE